MRKLAKNIMILAMCITFSVTIYGCGNKQINSADTLKSTDSDHSTISKSSDPSNPSELTDHGIGTFEVVCLKAGKADAMILRTANSTVIIDTGEDKEGPEMVSDLEKLNIGTIDDLIITHFDSDHVGGADKVLDKFNVKNVIQSDCPQNSEDYREYIDMLNKKNITPVTVRNDMTFLLDNVQYTIDPPEETTYVEKPSNNSSLVISAVHGENRFLFTGDAENARLQELINKGNLEHTFLKVPYHGFYQTILPQFLNLVKPKYAVITSSDKQTESKETLDALEAVGTKVYLTRNGKVTVKSDGENMVVLQ